MVFEYLETDKILSEFRELKKETENRVKDIAEFFKESEKGATGVASTGTFQSSAVFLGDFYPMTTTSSG